MWRDEVAGFANGLNHPAWGISHSRRTYHQTLALAAADGASVREPVVFAVAYLHDAGAFPRFSDAGTTPPEAAAHVAEELLSRADFPAEDRTDVVRIIASHDFERQPLDLPEARYFHDADMLDFLGAVGVARLLSIAGLEDWTPNARSAVETARDFAERLPKRVVTPAARTAAVERALETRTWLAWLDEETADLAEL